MKPAPAPGAADWGLPERGLALGLAVGGDPERGMLDRVEEVEALGFHSVWVPEMHFAAGATASPLLLLRAFAARSRRLRLGTTSLLLPLHGAARLAVETTALDRASGGRLLLGLGRGFRRALFDAFGADASRKRDRFDEVLDELLRRWAASPAPAPPLAVAAFGPKGLAQAARRGLPYLASPVEPWSELAAKLRSHGETLAREGHPPAPVIPVMRTVHVAPDARGARGLRRALEAESRSSAARLPPSLAAAAGAPLDERVVVGTEAQVEDALAARCQELGMNLLIVRPLATGLDPEARRESLARLAELAARLSPPRPG